MENKMSNSNNSGISVKEDTELDVIIIQLSEQLSRMGDSSFRLIQKVGKLGGFEPQDNCMSEEKMSSSSESDLSKFRGIINSFGILNDTIINELNRLERIV